MNAEFDLKSLANAIHSRRQNEREMKLSRAEAARQIGISPTTLEKVEKEGMPDLTTYAKICLWLNTPLESFLKDTRGIVVFLAYKWSDYSTSSPAGVFSEDKILEAKRFFGHPDYTPLPFNSLPDHPEGTFPYVVRMNKRGVAQCSSCDHEDVSDHPRWRPDGFAMYVYAKDGSDAVRIADQKRRDCIQNGEWKAG